MTEKLISLISKFNAANILVIGDVILDEYILGDVSRINPEAPVPVLNVAKTKYYLGGAANVACNIKSLGGKCLLVGQGGNDENHKLLLKILDKWCISHNFVINKHFTTIKKTRVIARNQQVIRIDWEQPQHLTNNHVRHLFKVINPDDFDVVIISDYNKGMITRELINKLKTYGVKILVDPKPANIDLYHDVYVIKSNLKEGQEIAKTLGPQEIGKIITKNYNTNLILTQGSQGASLYLKDTNEYHYLPAKTREIYDVSGAGDTFISTLALVTAVGTSLYDATFIANQAAGIVITKLGTAIITQQELIQSLKPQSHIKIKALPELRIIVKQLREQNKKIVFTNGCFDILHVGHTTLLKQAKKFGDVLILGLNTDKSIRRIKGSARPINTQEDRAELLSHIESVDYIVLFDENTPEKLIFSLQPDIHVKGGDYNLQNLDQMPEAKMVYEYGGKVKIIDVVKGKSTTSIVNRFNDDVEGE